MIPGIGGMSGLITRGSGTPLLQLSYLGHNNSASGSVSLGTAPGAGERRWIVVNGAGNNALNVTITGISIAGSAGTVLVNARSDSGLGYTANAIYFREVTTGTTGTVTVTYSGTVAGAGAGFHVWRIISGPDGIIAGNTYKSESGNNPSASVSASANSVLIGGAMGRNGGPYTWSFLTEDNEVDLSSADYSSAASRFNSSAVSAQSIGITASTHGDDGDILAIGELRAV